MYLGGGSAREVPARGCERNLAPEIFPPGRAAATIMVRESTILAALPPGILTLTPVSTARQLRDWLMTTALPFGLASPAGD